MAVPEARLKELRERFAQLQQALRDRQAATLRLQDLSVQKQERIRQLQVEKAELEQKIKALEG